MPGLFRRPMIGLALGGGGARGLAHLGVLKVFEREGIPIDCLSGTSMGGMLGAIYAAGKPIADMQAEALRMASPSQMFRLVDPLPPRRGLLRGERVAGFVSEMLGQTRSFSELSLPFAVTAVDLVTQREVALQSGSLVDAVMATIALPGFFPPREIGEQQLVDGGVLNSVPADVARRLGGEVIVAVDVNYGRKNALLWGDSTDTANIPGISGLIPGFIMEMYRAEVIMLAALTEYRLKSARPNVLIRPEISDKVTVLFGFPHVEEIIAAGESAAISALPQIKKLLKPGLHWPTRIKTSLINQNPK